MEQARAELLGRAPLCWTTLLEYDNAPTEAGACQVRQRLPVLVPAGGFACHRYQGVLLLLGEQPSRNEVLRRSRHASDVGPVVSPAVHAVWLREHGPE